MKPHPTKANNPGSPSRRPKAPGFDDTPHGCEVRVRPFSRGHISKRIPLGIAVTQYLGFMPMDLWESATHSLNLKYWVTALSLYRYGLEKWGVASHSYNPDPLTNRMLNNHFTSRAFWWGMKPHPTKVNNARRPILSCFCKSRAFNHERMKWGREDVVICYIFW
jgi:hypothetical protein